MMLRSMYYAVKEGVRNVIRWFPVIWQDRDWDERYLLRIMRHKLKHMEEYFRYHSRAEESEKDADNIKHTIEILDRLIADRYLFEAGEEGYELKEKDIQELFSFLSEHIGEWWD